MRRAIFLISILLLVPGIAPTACHAAAKTAATASAVAKTQKPDEVGPVECLMREHGVLSRILLIYDELARRIESGKLYPPVVLKSVNGVVRQFVEEYHEKREEGHLFPIFEKTTGYADLVKVLRKQHRAGRKLTDDIKAFSADGKKGKQLARALRAFVRLYRPHTAREDTVLYPALRTLVQPRAFRALGDIFEDEEQEYFGKGGFEKVVKDVAALEKELGLYDLSQYTAQ